MPDEPIEGLGHDGNSSYSKLYLVPNLFPVISRLEIGRVTQDDRSLDHRRSAESDCWSRLSEPKPTFRHTNGAIGNAKDFTSGEEESRCK